MGQPLALITGVGDGTGAALARRFHAGGYRVAMTARNPERLSKLEAELPDAKAYICDLEDLDALHLMLKQIRDEMGYPNLLIHNAVRATFARFDQADPTEFEKNFRVNATALLYLARFVVSEMLKAASGTIIVTGNTSAYRGLPDFALFSPTKAAQRILTEALGRQLGPQGIHVAYVTIDAPIDTPWTMHRHLDKPEDAFSKPADIAEEVYHIAHQARSTWSSELVIRPFREPW